MISAEGRLVRIFPYRTVYFPRQQDIPAIFECMKPLETLRLFFTFLGDDRIPHKVEHRLSLTIWNDLNHSLDKLWRLLARYTREEIKAAEKLGARIKISRGSPQALTDFS